MCQVWVWGLRKQEAIFNVAKNAKRPSSEFVIDHKPWWNIDLVSHFHGEVRLTSLSNTITCLQCVKRPAWVWEKTALRCAAFDDFHNHMFNFYIKFVIKQTVKLHVGLTVHLLGSLLLEVYRTFKHTYVQRRVCALYISISKLWIHMMHGVAHLFMLFSLTHLWGY